MIINEIKKNDDKKEDEEPDAIETFSLGEVCESYGASIVFKEVYITDKILDSSFKYIVFSGEIESSNDAFVTDNVFVDIRLKNIDFGESVTFEKELSKRESEADLMFDGERGKMSGSFSLIFSLSNEAFEKIKANTENQAEENGRIHLYPAISFTGKGEVCFSFDFSDITI
ncbi:MAG: hypothetical protein IJY23_09000 [Clostridia bacterium]|nr:hypothetical protein [Clostridia bacterium]